MTDTVLQNALARRAAAYEEARRWDDFIRMYGEVSAEKPQDLVRRRSGVVVRQTGSIGALAETEAEVIGILEAAGQPMNTRDLLSVLEERNFPVGGKDPASTLSARLSRAPKLQNISGKGWWMRELAGDERIDLGTSPAMEDFRKLFPRASTAEGREAGPGGGT